MKNTILALVLMIVICTNLSSQFSTTYNASTLGPNVHLIHNSITKSRKGPDFYAVASTIEINGGYDIYVTKVDVSGNIVWGKIIDINQDDRALDVLIDDRDNIVVVGYTGNQSRKELYIAKFDVSGSFIKDFKLLSDLNSVGTKIIQSKFSGEYVVGGYEYDVERSFNMPSKGLVFQLKTNLRTINWKSHYWQTDVNNTVTDLVELPTGNIFITGSVGGNRYDQVVLASIINPFSGGAIMPGCNLSFNNGENYSLGASAVYDDKKDEIWLLFNSGKNSVPYYIRIKDATSGSPILNPRSFGIGKPGGFTDKFAGFKIAISPSFSNSLTIFGYKDQTTFPAPVSKFGIWAVDVKKYQLFPVIPPSTNTNMRFWDPSGTSTTNIQHRGGGVLSLMSSNNNNGAPYFHTPNMMVESHNDNKFIVTSYDDQSTSNIETSLLAFNNNLMFSSSSCLLLKDIRLIQKNVDSETTYTEPCSFGKRNYIGSPIDKTFYGTPYCSISNIAVNGSRNSLGDSDSENDDKAFISKAKINIYPNPSSDIVNIVSEKEIKKIEIINSVGQIIISKGMTSSSSKSIMDVNQLVRGVYMIRVLSLDGAISIERFIKN